MNRCLQFWSGALTSSMLLAGCATSHPVRQYTRAAPDISPAASQVSEDASSKIAPAQPQARIQAVSYDAAGMKQADQASAASAAALPVVSIASAVNVTGNPDSNAAESTVASESSVASASESTVPINLPTALAMIGGQHPVVEFARWRVQEAYAQLDRAEVMWLPSIQTGFNYRRRDGNYQAVDGSIVDVNLNSMNYGLGTGAVAAGSPTRPGVVAQFHLADALFLPKAAEKTAWARGHAASAALNQQLLNGSTAYIELLEAYQDAQIISAAVERTAELTTLTANFAEAVKACNQTQIARPLSCRCYTHAAWPRAKGSW